MSAQTFVSKCSLSSQDQKMNRAAYLALLRNGNEYRSLLVAFFAMGVMIVFVGLISLGLAFFLIAFLFWTTLTVARINHRRHIGNAVRIGKRQFPALAEQTAISARKLQVSPVQVFVYQEDQINAYAFGWNDPYSIVLTSACVDAFDKDEFRFVIGHEMGHVILNHTRVNTLLGGVLGAPNIPFLSFIFAPFFMWWSRCAEYSADRAGLIACGDLEEAMSALVKLLVGTRLAHQVNLDEILNQSQELSGKMDALASEMGQSHPSMVHRLRELKKFWKSSEYQRLLELTGRE